MPLTTNELNSYLTTLEQYKDVPSEAQSSIGTYYQYLEQQGIDYGTIGYRVSQNIGDYGQLANQIIFAAGASTSTLDQVRYNLAIMDATLRRDSLNIGGTGILNPRQITDYHYDAFTNINLPREAFGGALFEEFIGTGSWVAVAKDGDYSGISAQDVLGLSEAIVNGAVSAAGINARSAQSLALSAAAALPAEAQLKVFWDSVGFQMEFAIGGYVAAQLKSGILLPNAFAVPDTSYFFHTLDTIPDTQKVADTLTVTTDETVTLNNGALAISSDIAELSSERVATIATQLNEAAVSQGFNLFTLDNVDLSVDDVAGSHLFKVKLGTGTETITATEDNTIIIGSAAGNGLSYAAFSEGVDVDLSSRNTIRAAGGAIKDIFIGVNSVVGSDHNDAFRGTMGANTQVAFAGGKGDDVYELYSSDQTRYNITDSEGNDILELNSHPLSGTASPVTNRAEGTTYTLKSQDDNLYILTRMNEGGVVSSEGMHLQVKPATDGNIIKKGVNRRNTTLLMVV